LNFFDVLLGWRMSEFVLKQALWGWVGTTNKQFILTEQAVGIFSQSPFGVKFLLLDKLCDIMLLRGERK